jgi:hypothetical protein
MVMTMNSQIKHNEIRENILALKLMQNVFLESQSLSADILSYSLENQLYHRIFNSFAWNADLPFIICMERSYPRDKITKIEPGKKRSRGYCLSDDEKFLKAAEIFRHADKEAEYSEKVGRDIFSGAMEEIAQRLPSGGSSFITSTLASDISLRIWDVTHSVQNKFIALVQEAWGESGNQLIEIAITIDADAYYKEVNGIVGLYDLPSDVTRAYYHGFSEFYEMNSALINETSIAIDEVQKLSSEFPSDFLESYISDTIAHLEHQHRVVNDFDSRIRKGSSKNIRVYDTSLDGFLNYPLPPM